MDTLLFIIAQTESSGSMGLMNIFMIVALIAIFYFFMIRPQSKRQKEINKFREGLTVGSKVITAGGIHGIIKEVKPDSFLLEISDGVKIKIDKGSIYPSAEAAAENNQKN